MTAQDKAKELLSKMNVIHYMKLGGKNKDSKGLPVSMYNDQIKQCALIAVDESINILDKICKSSGYDPFESPLYDLKYWKEIKQEIEKL